MNFYIFYTKGGRRGTDPLLENFQPRGEGGKSSNPIVGNYLRICFQTKLSSVRGLLPPEPAVRGRKIRNPPAGYPDIRRISGGYPDF